MNFEFKKILAYYWTLFLFDNSLIKCDETFFSEKIAKTEANDRHQTVDRFSRNTTFKNELLGKKGHLLKFLSSTELTEDFGEKTCMKAYICVIFTKPVTRSLSGCPFFAATRPVHPKQSPIPTTETHQKSAFVSLHPSSTSPCPSPIRPRQIAPKSPLPVAPPSFPIFPSFPNPPIISPFQYFLTCGYPFNANSFFPSYAPMPNFPMRQEFPVMYNYDEPMDLTLPKVTKEPIQKLEVNEESGPATPIIVDERR